MFINLPHLLQEGHVIVKVFSREPGPWARGWLRLLVVFTAAAKGILTLNLTFEFFQTGLPISVNGPTLDFS